MEANTRMDQLLPYHRARAHIAAALVGAPPLIILDEYTVYQKFSMRRSIYNIVYHLLNKGHGVLISSSRSVYGTGCIFFAFYFTN